MSSIVGPSDRTGLPEPAPQAANEAQPPATSAAPADPGAAESAYAAHVSDPAAAAVQARAIDAAAARPLSSVLARLYDSPEAARRVASDSQLDLGAIDFSGSARDIWKSTLGEAQRSRKLGDLVTTARGDFPAVEDLARWAAGAPAGPLVDPTPRAAAPAPRDAAEQRGERVLVRALADLYPEPDGARMAASDAGLDGTQIDFSGSALARWSAVVRHAESTGALGTLVESCAYEAPDRAELRAFREGGLAKLGAPPFTDRIPSPDAVRPPPALGADERRGERVLVRAFADLYPDSTKARRVASDAGLDPAEIDFSGSSLDAWSAVVQHAQSTGTLGALVESCASDGHREELEAFRAGGLAKLGASPRADSLRLPDAERRTLAARLAKPEEVASLSRALVEAMPDARRAASAGAASGLDPARFPPETSASDCWQRVVAEAQARGRLVDLVEVVATDDPGLLAVNRWRAAGPR
jgi:hypothetical protein